MAPRSSMMATAVKKTLSDAGTRLPSRTRMPRAKAMSVAMGIPQPRSATGLPQLIAAKIRAGTAMPPKAATAGSSTCDRVASSPSSISRLISSPTRKKKTAIQRSLTQTTSGLDSTSAVPPCRPPRRNSPGMWRKRWYASPQGELLSNKAASAATARRTPPSDWDGMN